jgi:putative FmdB family regulatory protein
MVRMPIYEYACRKCGYKFELFRHFYDSDQELACPMCKEKSLVKQVSTFSSAGSGCGTASYSGG